MALLFNSSLPGLFFSAFDYEHACVPSTTTDSEIYEDIQYTKCGTEDGDTEEPLHNFTRVTLYTLCFENRWNESSSSFDPLSSVVRLFGCLCSHF